MHSGHVARVLCEWCLACEVMKCPQRGLSTWLVGCGMLCCFSGPRGMVGSVFASCEVRDGGEVKDGEGGRKKRFIWW